VKREVREVSRFWNGEVGRRKGCARRSEEVEVDGREERPLMESDMKMELLNDAMCGCGFKSSDSVKGEPRRDGVASWPSPLYIHAIYGRWANQKA
jgi:hypothetical protein